WKNPLFTHLAIFLKLVLAELRLDLKKSPSGFLMVIPIYAKIS
ncbi:hypothetical protein, partial [uncultured Gammaproteobacteria bacterium]